MNDDTNRPDAQGAQPPQPEDAEPWRFKRHEELLRMRTSTAGLPLMEATDEAPQSEKTVLLFERS